jgi:hypothetical protein
MSAVEQGPPRVARDLPLLLILLSAVLIRGYLALATSFVWDEAGDWIRIAREISLDPLRLPIREGQHPALPAYLIRAGAELLGPSALGYRLANVLAGTLTVLVVAVIAREWSGAAAGRWAAALVALNEYHLGVSTLATEKAAYLLFCAFALAGFGRFLADGRARALYAAAVAAGLACLCREIAVLLLPAFLVTLLTGRERGWLLRREPYLALGLFLIVISPDLVWNAVHPVGAPPQTSYLDHLRRIGGGGLNPDPLLFYGRRTGLAALSSLTGGAYEDPAAEYPAMNPLLGALLLGGLVGGLRPGLAADPRRRLLLTSFLLVLGSFVFVVSGPTTRQDLDRSMWFWVDMTLLPGAVLAGAALLRRPDLLRLAARGVAVAGLSLAMLDCASSRLGMPAYSIGFFPGTLAPADGRLVDVMAHFHACMLCDREPRVTLEAVELRQGRQRRPAKPDVEIQDAEIGAADHHFRLRALEEEGLPLGYAFTYRIDESDGHSHTVNDTVGIVRRADERHPIVFWVPVPPGGPR